MVTAAARQRARTTAEDRAAPPVPAPPRKVVKRQAARKSKPAGHLVGYARVSTAEQDPALQLDASLPGWRAAQRVDLRSVTRVWRDAGAERVRVLVAGCANVPAAAAEVGVTERTVYRHLEEGRARDWPGRAR